MRDVGLGHDQTIVTGFREHSTAGCAAMNRDKLAYRIACADARLRWLAPVLQILRSKTDRDEREDVCAIADVRAPVYHGVRFDAHIFAKRDFIADDSVRAYVTARADFRARSDDC